MTIHYWGYVLATLVTLYGLYQGCYKGNDDWFTVTCVGWVVMIYCNICMFAGCGITTWF